MTWLAIVAGIGALAIVLTTGVSLAFRRGPGLRASLLPPLLATAISLLAVAFTQVWIGGRIKPSEQSGLWASGTITAFPTSVTALGATFVSLWVVLYTAENTLRATQRHDQTLEAEERRRQGAELISRLNSLDDVISPIRKFWTEGIPEGTLWPEINALWRNACSGGLGEPASLASSDPCRAGHRVGLPDPNCLTPVDTPGRLQVGCVHFTKIVETRLPSLQELARTVAVNKVSDADRVRDVLQAVAPLIDNYGLPSRVLLSDAQRLSKYYPPAIPDPSTADGKLLLAQIMTSTYLAATAKNEWRDEISSMAINHGVTILDSGDSARRDNWIRVCFAAERRAQLRASVLARMQEGDQVIGVGPRSAFWQRIGESVAKDAG